LKNRYEAIETSSVPILVCAVDLQLGKAVLMTEEIRANDVKGAVGLNKAFKGIAVHKQRG
jgi:hypothetical protein